MISFLRDPAQPAVDQAWPCPVRGREPARAEDRIRTFHPQEFRCLVCIDDEGHWDQTVTGGLITDARYGAVQLDVVGMGVP